MVKCLVVDDVEVTRFTAIEHLSAIGAEVDAVKNGPEAMAALQRTKYDVVFLDWHLGEDSGLDVLQEIRSNHSASIPVVICSGVESVDKSSEVTAAGANDFLQKPTTREKLESSLNKLGIKLS